MDGNYTNGGQPYPGGDPQWDNKQWNNGQWQGQQQYWQGGNPQWQAPQPKSQVKDVFCNLLLVIFILQIVVSLVMLNDILSVMQFSGYYNGAYPELLYSGGYVACSVIAFALSIAMIVFLVLDIVKINKAGYKITGLILFAIFLRPGYYIWRAYILGRKKTFPIIYTVSYSLLVAGSVIYSVVGIFRMVFDMAAYY